MSDVSSAPAVLSPLDRARRKAYWRLIPLLFVCYIIAYVDRANVGIAKLTMVKDIPGFTDAVIGFGAGVFFIGYFLLEIPGTLIVERWSARKWICRIMITWGIMAAMTAFVQARIPGFTQVAELLMRLIVWIATGLSHAGIPWLSGFAGDVAGQFAGPSGLAVFQFYSIRFLLGLAEAGFFPGVIVFLTHWFPARDRSRTLAYFFVATPLAMMISPKISNLMLKIGTTEVIDGVSVSHPAVLGLVGWQWVYVFWGIPAVILGFMVYYLIPDKPRDAKWLAPDEREALEQELAAEKERTSRGKRMTVMEALRHPKVLMLAAAYFFCVTANYGVEFFLPSILQDWYQLKLNNLTWLVILPPALSLIAQLTVGWSSDRMKERRLHAVIPIVTGSLALFCAALSKGNVYVTVACFMVATAGLKAYLPAFWSMPSLFLTSSAAAGSIGLINSVGNLGGFLGPALLGWLKTNTGSYQVGVCILAGSMLVTATMLFYFVGLGKRHE
ncbi:MAG: MFS transporter [Verrucomicrobia bacterium]|nr:MFS transporter [Verrucomicrobiota bacterium]